MEIHSHKGIPNQNYITQNSSKNQPVYLKISDIRTQTYRHLTNTSPKMNTIDVCSRGVVGWSKNRDPRMENRQEIIIVPYCGVQAEQDGIDGFGIQQ